MSARNRRQSLIIGLASFSIAIFCVSCSKRKEMPATAERASADEVEQRGQRALLPEYPELYSIEHWPNPRTASTTPWEKKYLDAKTDAERIEIVSEKQTSGPEFLAPILRRALHSESLELCAQAIDSAYVLRGEDAIDVLSGAACHSPEEIAILATEAAREFPFETRIKIYENTLTSPHETVRELTVIELSREESKLAIDLLILGLLDPSKSIVDITNQGLQRRFHRAFDSASAAKLWWDENQHEYSDTLRHNIAH